jgi:hypothetical protein
MERGFCRLNVKYVRRFFQFQSAIVQFEKITGYGILGFMIIDSMDVANKDDG